MLLNKFDLKGRVAIVTGASRGLGAGMAIGLAEAGADLVVVASSARLQETVDKIKALGRRCIGVQADLIDTKVIPTIIDATLKEYGRLDILINSAGIIRRAPALEFSEKDWDEVVQINQKAVFFLCQAAAREMAKQKKGKIVNIASLLSSRAASSFRPTPLQNRRLPASPRRLPTNGRRWASMSTPSPPATWLLK